MTGSFTANNTENHPKEISLGWFCLQEEAAYRELFEETGISCNDMELDYFMDINYFKYQNDIQVFYGILKHEVNLVEEKNKLEW